MIKKYLMNIKKYIIIIIILGSDLNCLEASENINFIHFTKLRLGVTLDELKSQVQELFFSPSIGMHYTTVNDAFFSNISFEFKSFYDGRSGKTFLGILKPKLIKVSFHSDINRKEIINFDKVMSFRKTVEKLWGLDYEEYLAYYRHNKLILPCNLLIWYKDNKVIVAYILSEDSIRHLQQSPNNYNNTPFTIEIGYNKFVMSEIQKDWKIIPQN